MVDEIGEGVTGVSVGEEVFGRGQATHAEFAVLGTWAAKPSSVDWAVAAGAGVAGETAERGLRLLGVRAGELDEIEPLPEPSSLAADTDAQEAAWRTAVEAASWLVGKPQAEVAPDELYEKLKPFEERVAADIEESRRGTDGT